ncbi:MAG: bifunctional adenosylcobinamide kinase/adenosylcobinamide-phosphate guanylyltransferase [Defluviitaleaceae bacterium]|nr:bifunctional adenosylcobinamide kinase/adenosylcobinamide-phosphate guanylyltransferase [Defluviitaleaceae bacterium]
MRIFISGGCKNGKSFYAQRLAARQKSGALYYIATMTPADGEDGERIARHRAERGGWGFTTIEQPASIEKILEKCGTHGSFLLDSLTALLANEMFLPGGGVNENAADKIISGMTRMLGEINNIVVVSDYIYGDAIIYEGLTELYRRSLARIDCAAARLCETVLEVNFSSVTVRKGQLPDGEINHKENFI